MALDTDWGYQLADKFLTAATSCGFDCDVKRVTEWGEYPVTCGTDCGCELIVSVLEGIAGTSEKCGLIRTARVSLTLVVCWPPPSESGGRDYAVDAGRARDNSISRTLIVQGLIKGWRAGKLCIDDGGCIGGTCTPMKPQNGWVERPVQGPCKAFSLEWLFTTPM